jgi:hypothetical protein
MLLLTVIFSSEPKRRGDIFAFYTRIQYILNMTLLFYLVKI